MRQVLDQNVVTNSPRLYRTIQAVLRAISADPGLADPAALAGLAFSIRDIDPAEIVFTELPVVAAPTDPNRVVWTEDATAIWERIAADEPPPGHETPSPSPDGERGGASGEPSGGASGQGTDAGAGEEGGDDAVGRTPVRRRRPRCCRASARTEPRVRPLARAGHSLGGAGLYLHDCCTEALLSEAWRVTSGRRSDLSAR